jgi:hypothetical protein
MHTCAAFINIGNGRKLTSEGAKPAKYFNKKKRK